ncbi:hypothetical protein BGZ76_000308 [Entomortierella beljakovae]|nr:hypothetical protein BGZ76_000308 [Entomortierella beljakovae]
MVHYKLNLYLSDLPELLSGSHLDFFNKFKELSESDACAIWTTGLDELANKSDISMKASLKLLVDKYNLDKKNGTLKRYWNNRRLEQEAERSEMEARIQAAITANRTATSAMKSAERLADNHFENIGGSKQKDVDNTAQSTPRVPSLPTPNPLQDNEDNGSEDEELKVDEKSPYAHLIMRLYKKYGCSPHYFPPRTNFASDMEEEIYKFAEGLLDTWDECDKVQQKDCFVALSGVINTIDNDDQESCFSNFKDIANMFQQEHFFSTSERQQAIFDTLIDKLGYGERQKAKREELKIMRIMEFLCTEIEFLRNIPKTSEHEDVFVWRGIARILHGHDIVVRVGELGSSSTREDRKDMEEQFGGKESNVRSRKIDILHQLTLRGLPPIELVSWEAKSEAVSSETLQIQQRKNIRINASILRKLRKYQEMSYPSTSPIVLDIVGPRALIYSVRLLEPHIFGAGAIADELIELPRTVDEIGDFLTNGNISALLQVAEQNTAFAGLIKKGFQKAHNGQIRAKMTGKNIILDSDTHPILFTPSKKRGTHHERPLMTIKKPRKPQPIQELN